MTAPFFRARFRRPNVFGQRVERDPFLHPDYQFGERFPFGASPPVRASLSSPAPAQPGFGTRLLHAIQLLAQSPGGFDFTKSDEEPGGLASFLTGGLETYGRVTGMREALAQQEREGRAEAEDRSLRRRLLESRILQSAQPPGMSFDEWRRRHDYRRAHPLPSRARPQRPDDDPHGAEEQRAIAEANRVWQQAQEGFAANPYGSWAEAYNDVLRRYQAAGRLPHLQPIPLPSVQQDLPVAPPIRARPPDGLQGGGPPPPSPGDWQSYRDEAAQLLARLEAEGLSDEEILERMRAAGYEVEP